jgi:hypothetical protein
VFSDQILYAFLIPSIPATCPTYLTCLELIAKIIKAKKTLQMMKVLITLRSLSSSYFLLLMSRYTTEHLVFCQQTTFFHLGNKTRFITIQNKFLYVCFNLTYFKQKTMIWGSKLHSLSLIQITITMLFWVVKSVDL